MITLQQLRYLVAIADTLSFSRAAGVVHVTQPTLSMQIRELENRLGARLIERNRARVVMTPQGAAIVQRARAVLSGVEEIREIARSGEADALQGVLRMGVVHTIGAYLLSVAMVRLRAVFPALRLYVREDRRDLLPRQLAEGVHDLLILPDPPGAHDLETRLLLREPLHLVMPADHRLAMQTAVAPADLAGETVLTMERGHRIHDQVAALCQQTGARLAHDYAGTTLDTLRQMVATGMGISLLPALYIRSEVLRESLVVARPLTQAEGVQLPVREIFMAWRRAAPSPARFEALAGLIAQCTAPYAAGQPFSGQDRANTPPGPDAGT